MHGEERIEIMDGLYIGGRDNASDESPFLDQLEHRAMDIAQLMERSGDCKRPLELFAEIAHRITKFHKLSAVPNEFVLEFRKKMDEVEGDLDFF